MLRDVCRITHHHDEAYAGALAIVAALRLVTAPDWDWQSSLPARAAALLPDTLVRDRLILLSELDRNLPLSQIANRYGCSGYVVHSVPLALYAVQRIASTDFCLMLDELIAVGGDTDTNAAMAGQIAGAWLGFERLPSDVVARLPQREFILSTAQRFTSMISVVKTPF